MLEYGENIAVNAWVELSPGYDLWMQGAKYGTVRSIRDGIATVKMAHSQVKKSIRVPIADLIRR